MNFYFGVIIEESLDDKAILNKIDILKTKISVVTEKHKTPWLTQWTMHDLQISESDISDFTQILSLSLDSKHAWYADIKNETYHYVIFFQKIFKVSRQNPKEYEAVVRYGLSLGIPDYQLDF